MALPPFQHTLLANPSQCFRVVQVIPQVNRNDHIRCTLTTLSLEANKEQYLALSYLWGAEKPLFEIDLDGQQFHIREHLYHFLRQAQLRFANISMFIDAICIDQLNIPERNAQVQIMGNIYRHSKLTLSWLGQGNPGVEDALPFIYELSNSTIAELKQWYEGHDRRSRQQRWACIYLMCDLRYWSRVWIVQELLKPKEVTLLYGEHELTWNQLFSFLNKVRNARLCPAPLPNELYSSRLNTFDMSRHAIGRQVGTFGSMRSVLLEYASSQCSESRDRLFALLSLGVGGQRMIVDYAKPQSDLFMEAVQLWGGKTNQEALILAKSLVDGLIPSQNDVSGRENDPRSFNLNLITLQVTSNHGECTSDKLCSASERTIEIHGVKEQIFWMNGALKETRDRPPIRACIHGMKHSQMLCSDIILQVEDTSLFFVTRLVHGDPTIVARLAIVIEEDDAAVQTLVYWLPWSRTLAKMSVLGRDETGDLILSLNVSSLRTLLITMSHKRTPLEVRAPGNLANMNLDSISWQDESHGSFPISIADQVQAIYRKDYLSRLKSNPSLKQPEALSMPQAYQALKTASLETSSPQHFEPAASWKDLLGRQFA